MKALVTAEPHADFMERGMTIARRLDAGEAVPPQDYRLSFATEAQLFSEITPQRWRLLILLQQQGLVRIRVLAQALDRNYSNVYQDVQRLIELGLIEKTSRGVRVPWDAIELRLSTVRESQAA
jgi:predicted transcriptional regulator